MGAALIITLIFLIGLAVGGYFLYKKVTTMYFSESFMIGPVEYAIQDLDKFDKFKDKIYELDENDHIKFLKSFFDKNLNFIYPLLKNNLVLVYICGFDTSFSKINKSLSMNNFDYSVTPKYMYNNSTNELLEFKYNNNGTIYFGDFTETNLKDILKDNIKKVI